MTENIDGAAISKLMAGYRVTVPNEAALQLSLDALFTEQGWRFDREHRLGDHDRPDFFLEGLALEVKVDGSITDVARQLARYAEHDAVTELVLVTTRVQHKHLPSTLNSKRLTVVHVGSVL